MRPTDVSKSPARANVHRSPVPSRAHRDGARPHPRRRRLSQCTLAGAPRPPGSGAGPAGPNPAPTRTVWPVHGASPGLRRTFGEQCTKSAHKSPNVRPMDVSKAPARTNVHTSPIPSRPTVMAPPHPRRRALFTTHAREAPATNWPTSSPPPSTAQARRSPTARRVPEIAVNTCHNLGKRPVLVSSRAGAIGVAPHPSKPSSGARACRS